MTLNCASVLSSLSITNRQNEVLLVFVILFHAPKILTTSSVVSSSLMLRKYLQRARWSAPKYRTIGPDRSNGPLVQTGLMIFLTVLDRFSYADGPVWTNGSNGSRVEFESVYIIQ